MSDIVSFGTNDLFLMGLTLFAPLVFFWCWVGYYFSGKTKGWQSILLFGGYLYVFSADHSCCHNLHKRMTFPFEPVWWDIPINMHLILEYLAFFVAFRHYVYLRKNSSDQITSANRLSIIIGAIFGALLFSRLIAFLENPVVHYEQGWIALVNNKTIMGGLFGGLLGVELAKKIIGKKQSSGDLFTLPIILGIIIGWIGCFVTGIQDFTYGTETTSFLGMDLGDGLKRHPIALYEIVFLMAGKIFMILAGVYLLISLGTCGDLILGN